MPATRWLSATLLCAAASTAAAQDVGRGQARVFGSVVDSATLEPVPRVRVCVRLPGPRRGDDVRCGRAGPDGSYAIDGLPAGRFATTAFCSAIVGRSVTLEGDSIVLAEGTLARRDLRIDPRGCDLRPSRTVVGTFRGHYTPGFESSSFVPCPADAWFQPGDSLHLYPYDARDAWVEPTPSTRWSMATWPEAPRDSFGNPRYYARFRGTIRGPGQFGHMGVSVFELLVDSILVIRAPAADDCELIEGRPSASERGRGRGGEAHRPRPRSRPISASEAPSRRMAQDARRTRGNATPPFAAQGLRPRYLPRRQPGDFRRPWSPG